MRRHYQYTNLKVTFADMLGRETNSVRRVWRNGSRDSAYAPLSTGTAYPYGTDNYSVTADPLGVPTVTRIRYEGNAEITEAASAGVTNRTVRVRGGAITSEKQWTDPVSGLHLTRATRTAKDWDANGCETETVSVSRNGGGWINESVTVKDFLGRVVSSARAGFGGAMLVSSNLYDSAGRTLMTVGHDGARTIYAYDTLGDSAGTVRIGAGQTMQFDPLSFALANVIALDAYVVGETLSWKEEGDLGLSAHGVPSAFWDCNASVSHIPGQGSVTTSVQRVQLTGLSVGSVKRLVSTDANGVTVITTEAVEAANAKTTVSSVNTAIGAFDVAESVAGVQTAGTNSLGGAISYTFDGFARQVTATEIAGSRTLQRATGYHGDGTVAFKAEIGGTTSNVTTYSARQCLQQPESAYTITTTDALGNATVNYYSGDGTRYRSEGAVYPTATARDTDGRQSELRTWRDETGQPDVTRWHYDFASGLVTNKVYADGLGPSYAYLPDGRLSLRAWARGVETAYGYADTANGAAQSASHSDGTPGVTNTYDLAGRLVSVKDGTGMRSFAYDAATGSLTAETNALAVITRCYDAQGRDAGYDLDIPGFATGTFSVRYGYDGHGRLDGVLSVLSGEINSFVYSFMEGTALVAGITNTAGFGRSQTYEPGRNLIAAVSNRWNNSLVSGFDYANDALGRRTLRVDTAQGLPVTNVFAYNPRSEVMDAAMGASTYSYSYDDIGNREWAAADASLSTYLANGLNQYTVVTNAGAGVAVAYDLDGNMITNGVWVYVWDAENRLVSASNTVSGIAIANAYDHLNRRVRKMVGPVMRHYVWDGWNIAAEIAVDAAAGTTNVHFYTWGLDLSGTPQGAGGVGGLLADTACNNQPATCDTYFPCYDANGNVTEYVESNGTVRARYEYSPFGEITAQSGDMADSFTHRFSTKPFDAETGLAVYQLRPYSPPFGRWLTKDPIEEQSGGLNLYGVVANDPVSRRDYLGLWEKGDMIEGGRRRVYIRQNGDTLEGLATLLKLALNEIHKWAKIQNNGKTFDGKKPCEVSVPNVIVVFTSRPSWFDIALSVVSSYRRTAESLSINYAKNGYKVIFAKHSESVSEFKALWKTSGIYGFIYAGHGAYPLGFKINGSFDGAVFPNEVSPPYKLGLGMFYACYSDNRGTGEYSSLGAWKDHIAIDSGAEYLGYYGLAWWWSDPNTENMGK